MDDEQRADWAGQRAMAWVIDDAPVDIDLAWTLVVIARRCDENGRGSYQSIPTLAAKTGKSADQVRRDIKRLLGAGLIREGDQTLPQKNGVPAGKWPTVYDVALEVSGPKVGRVSKNPTGRKKDDTPGMDATPGMEARGGMDATGTPCMDAGSTPCMDATQTKPLKNPINNPPSPYPLAADLEVVDAEIMEEGEESTSSVEQQIQTLIDEVVTLKPNWRTLRSEIREQIDGLMRSFGNNLEVVGRIAVGTAGMLDSAKPSRMTASGNPLIVAASLEQTIARVDSVDVSIPLHPDAHPFDRADNGRDCKHCPFPEANQRHRVGNRGGGYASTKSRTDRQPRRRGQHVPYRDPVDLSVYDKPFYDVADDNVDYSAYEGKL